MTQPKRPRVLAIIGWIVFAVVALGCGLLTVLIITVETGALGFVTGVVLAGIPVLPVVTIYLWLDRYEAEPPSLLVFTFAWGAAVATFGALVINTASTEVIRASGGDPTSASFLVAPFVEEGFKGLAVLLVLLLRRREFDGVIDGLVYAGMAGVGFAFVENILYLGRTLHEAGAAGTLMVFVIRCVVSPFAHPLFTAAIGVGLGIAARTKNWALCVLAPVIGYVVAVGLHAAWNLSASTGLEGFITAYILIQLPIFIGFILLAVFARRREGRLISRHLAVYASTGWLATGEVGMLASLAARRDARGWARRIGGPTAKRAMRDFQEMASELAFLRERMVRGAAPRDARHQEYSMLAAMSSLRGQFLPASGTPGGPGAGPGTGPGAPPGTGPAPGPGPGPGMGYGG
ncbi:MAG: PrsW family intrarane metalloprotease [Actinomycetota bacterium]|nr:PrsW family intrarane metalloprotease [Actinomycetota bacterium]